MWSGEVLAKRIWVSYDALQGLPLQEDPSLASPPHSCTHATQLVLYHHGAWWGQVHTSSTAEGRTKEPGSLLFVQQNLHAYLCIQGTESKLLSRFFLPVKPNVTKLIQSKQKTKLLFSLCINCIITNSAGTESQPTIRARLCLSFSELTGGLQSIWVGDPGHSNPSLHPVVIQHWASQSFPKPLPHL